MFANRLDAGETIFLERDLQTKLAQSKDVKHRKLRILKENVLPEHVKLITISDRTTTRQVFDKITLNS